MSTSANDTKLTGSSSTTKPTTASTTSHTTASASSGSARPSATGSASATGSTSASRLETLSKTVEFKWFVAHAVVVTSTLLSLVFFRLPRIASASYRIGYFAAFVSFAIILYQKYGHSKPSAAVLSHDNDFQYVVFTFLWLFTPRRELSLLPLAIFSLFHTLTYSRSYLLPALGYAAESPRVRQIDSIVKNYNEPLTVLAANFELALTVQLVLVALTFARGSWIQLVLYIAFFRVRYATSAYTRHAVKAWEVRVDQLLGHPRLPPAAKQYWVQFKGYLARIPGPANRP